jgi:hypothetical protein
MPLVQAKANLVSRISITMGIRIITKCGMILYSRFWGYVKSSIYDNLDHLSLPDGFTYVAKHRKKCLRKSGGIVTIFKKSLAHLLEFPDTSSEYVRLLKK